MPAWGSSQKLRWKWNGEELPVAGFLWAHTCHLWSACSCPCNFTPNTLWQQLQVHMNFLSDSSNITKETPLQHSTPPLSLDLLRAKHKLKNKGAFLQFVGHLSTDRMLLSKQATQLAATQVRFERVLVSKQSISDQTPFGNNCKLTGISNDLAISSRELS